MKKNLIETAKAVLVNESANKGAKALESIIGDLKKTEKSFKSKYKIIAKELVLQYDGSDEALSADELEEELEVIATNISEAITEFEEVIANAK